MKSGELSAGSVFSLVLALGGGGGAFDPLADDAEGFVGVAGARFVAEDLAHQFFQGDYGVGGSCR